MRRTCMPIGADPKRIHTGAGHGTWAIPSRPLRCSLFALLGLLMLVERVRPVRAYAHVVG